MRDTRQIVERLKTDGRILRYVHGNDSTGIIHDPPWMHIITFTQTTHNLQRHIPHLDRMGPGSDPTVDALGRIREVISQPKSGTNFPIVLSTSGT
jgi:hypothetical protein